MQLRLPRCLSPGSCSLALLPLFATLWLPPHQGAESEGTLPTLPSPLGRSTAWNESIVVQFRSMSDSESVDSDLLAAGWDVLPALLSVWGSLDLDSEAGANHGTLLAQIASTIAENDASGPSRESRLEDAPFREWGPQEWFDAYLDWRVEQWPDLQNERDLTQLRTRMLLGDLIDPDATRADVSDARKEILELEWTAGPAILDFFQGFDLAALDDVSKVGSVVGLMARFEGSPKLAWQDENSRAAQAKNIATLEELLRETLRRPLKAQGLRERPKAVPKRTWVEWERAVDALVESRGAQAESSAVAELDPGASWVALNSTRRLDLLEGGDLSAAEALLKNLERWHPEVELGSWDRTGKAQGALSMRDVLLAWHEEPLEIEIETEAEEPPEEERPAVERTLIGDRHAARARLRSRAGKPVEDAMEKGLLWLAANQLEDGSWSPEWEDGGGPDGYEHSVGVTGLAILSLLADLQIEPDKPFFPNVERGLEWLLEQQDSDTGLFDPDGGQSKAYGHAIATQAMAEALTLMPRPEYREAVALAVEYIEKSRNPYGAWRYESPPINENDSSITAWMISALAVAEEAGVRVDPLTFEGANGYLKEVTDADSGRAGYVQVGDYGSRIDGVNDHFPSELDESMSAAALWTTILCTSPRKSTERMLGYGRLLAAKPPKWDGRHINFYYWYWGSLASRQLGGRTWKAWEPALKSALLPLQEDEAELAGSWPPEGAWCHSGGRVYSTAMAVLTLQSYHRYADLVR